MTDVLRVEDRRPRAARRFAAALATAAVLLVVPSAASASATRIDVTSVDDFSYINGCSSAHPEVPCTLRQAVDVANGLTGQVDLHLTAATYQLTGLSGDDVNSSGDLDVTGGEDLNVIGANSTLGTSIVATTDAHDRIFDVSGGSSLHLENLDLSGGSITSGSTASERRGGLVRGVGTNVAVYVSGSHLHDGEATTSCGGGISVEGTGSDVSIESSALDDLSAAGAAAVCKIDGSFESAGSSFTGNTSSSSGGALNLSSIAQATVVSSTFASNTAAASGGAIVMNISGAPGTADFVGNTFAHNTVNGGAGGMGFATANGADYSGPGTGVTFQRNLFASGTVTAATPTGGALSCVFTSTIAAEDHDGRIDSPGCPSASPTDVAAPASAIGTTHPAVVDTVVRPAWVELDPTGALVDAGGTTCFGNDVRGGSRLVGQGCDIGATELGSRTDGAIAFGAARLVSADAGTVALPVAIDNLGDEAMPPQVVSITLPAGVTFERVDGALTCSFTALTRLVHCRFPVAPAHQSTGVDVVVTPAAAGAYAVSANFDYSGDTNLANDSGSTSFSVTDALLHPPVTPTGGGGATTGGGGTTPVTTTTVPATPVVPALPALVQPLVRLTGTTGTLRLRKGVLRVGVTCPAGVTARCTIGGSLASTAKVRFRVRSRTLTATCAKLVLAPGRSGTLSCTVPKAARTALAGKVVRMRLTVTARDGAGRAKVATANLRVRLS